MIALGIHEYGDDLGDGSVSLGDYLIMINDLRRKRNERDEDFSFSEDEDY